MPKKVGSQLVQSFRGVSTGQSQWRKAHQTLPLSTLIVPRGLENAHLPWGSYFPFVVVLVFLVFPNAHVRYNNRVTRH